MKKFLIKISFFSLLLLVIILSYTRYAAKILEYYHGSNTQHQISQSFTNSLKLNYDQLVLGNSRIYRGISPDQMTVETFNFAHDHDSYNQMYFKLLYLKEKNVKFKTLILGLDYFQFSFFSDKRNYAYAPYFHSDYFDDYPWSFHEVQAYENLRGIRMSHTIIVNSVNYYNNSVPHPLILKENGQFLVNGFSVENDTNFTKRNAHRHPLQENYFLKIIELAKRMNLNIYLVIPPTRKEELASYRSGIVNNYNLAFDLVARKKGVKLINYAGDTTYKYFHFSDFTHLNPEGANLFSKNLNDTILKLNQQPPQP